MHCAYDFFQAGLSIFVLVRWGHPERRRVILSGAAGRSFGVAIGMGLRDEMHDNEGIPILSIVVIMLSTNKPLRLQEQSSKRFHT